MRAAEEERHAESLRAADGDIGAGSAGLLQYGHGQGIGIDGDQAASLVHRRHWSGHVLNRSTGGRVG